MLVKVVRENSINGAIPSKIYVDGDFVCYGLENDLYKIPALQSFFLGSLQCLTYTLCGFFCEGRQLLLTGSVCLADIQDLHDT